ncbi:uncharacterized protein LOC127858728 [Dreissena polymorpha]|nr:uncharacterized protein LOC127858728 [Dreissena polymorpha]XP_052251930.1 uncharacterized protein LOC127858728 [Dreissena polymorpha]
MTWSGNMKPRETGRRAGRRRTSSGSSRGSPSPKLLEERCSPVEGTELPFFARPMLSTLRVSPPPRPADATCSRSPSPEGNAYAGAKFHDPPSPEFLPKPPSHWFCFTAAPEQPVSGCSDISSQLKMLLKVAPPTM